MKPSIFITGTGRSGSNVVKEILSLSPSVASLPFEHRYTVDPQGILPFYQQIPTWSPYIADHRLKELFSFLYSLAQKQVDSATRYTVPYADWELDEWIPGFSDLVAELEQSLIAHQYKASYPGSRLHHDPNYMVYYSPDQSELKAPLATFMRGCHEAICNTSEADILVEDNTWTCLFGRALVEIMPEALMLVMIRDPRDVITSFLGQRWTPQELDATTTYYIDLMQVWSEQRSQVSDASYLEVRLEDLVAAPDTTLELISSYTGIGVTAAMRQFDLSKSRSGRYKTELTATQIDYVTSRVAPYISHYNYLM